MTFYLKYRPQTLDELDITRVRESLKKIVTSGNIPHAFLFTGPKGIGKTSTARILAKVLNCENQKASGEPCNKCDQCDSITKGTNIDVIELDAASHRGIDDVRSLRESAKLVPARAKNKIYIIDEAHMLTTEAANALLKILEEPPNHVVFILATTNAEKIIDTIRSRAFNISFTYASSEEIIRSLERVAKGEHLKVDKESLKLVAQKAEGSFRDAHKTIEQLVSEKIPLDTASVREFLFSTRSFNVGDFISLLAKRDAQKALEEIESAATHGVSIANLLDTIVSRLKDALLAKFGIGGADLKEFTTDDLITLIGLMSEARASLQFATIVQLPLEIATVRWCEKEKQEVSDGKDLEDSKKAEEKQEPGVDQNENGENTKKANGEDHIESNIKLDEVWVRILAQARGVSTTTEALLRAARPMEYDGKTLSLGVFYSFHKERLEAHPHREILEDLATTVLGNSVKVICSLSEPPAKEVAKEEDILTEGEDEDIIKVAKEIFGS